MLYTELCSPSFSFIVQLMPSTPVTALNFLESRNLLAIGCEFGFVLCDMATQTALVRKSMTSGAGIYEFILARICYFLVFLHFCFLLIYKLHLKQVILKRWVRFNCLKELVLLLKKSVLSKPSDFT